jgi:hypothetical protein
MEILMPWAIGVSFVFMLRPLDKASCNNAGRKQDNGKHIKKI